MQLLFLVFIGALGASLTYLLQQQGLSAVVASCLIGLLGAGVGQATEHPHIATVCFAGSFAGMTAITVAPLPAVMAAGALAGLIYSLTLSFFPGFGGRLGTIAFISCCMSIFLLKLFYK